MAKVRVEGWNRGGLVGFDVEAEGTRYSPMLAERVAAELAVAIDRGCAGKADDQLVTVAAEAYVKTMPAGLWRAARVEIGKALGLHESFVGGGAEGQTGAGVGVGAGGGSGEGGSGEPV